MEIDGSTPSKGITIFGALLYPPPHSTNKLSNIVEENNSAAVNHDSVPALASTSPKPAGLERPEVAGVVQSSALFVQPEGEQVGNPTFTPDDQTNPKRSRGRPKKAAQTSTSTSSGSKRTKSTNNDWPDWLPQDWQIITKTRKTGTGYDYKTYVSPDGSRCRSKPEVLKKLNQ